MIPAAPFALSLFLGLTGPAAVHPRADRKTPAPRSASPRHTAAQEGAALFRKNWTVAEGLGPRINGRSCAACHNTPKVGGSGINRSVFVAQSPSQNPATGGHALQRFLLEADGAQTSLRIPARVSYRKPPSLFGLGLLEAVPDEEILALARAERSLQSQIAGELPRTFGGYGRFGWKSTSASVSDFISGALADEMGLTTTLYPTEAGEPGTNRKPEVSEADLAALTSFVATLPRPPAGPSSADSEAGEEIFARIGCVSCHVPTVHTGPSPIPELAHRTIHPYTDLLVHDMGSDLDDGITEGQVGGRFFRTAPLWGVGQTGPPYLHDGRARSLGEAIELHGGQAQEPANAYRNLSSPERRSLLAFLRSL